MLDTNRTTQTKTKPVIQLAIACPICLGRGKAMVPCYHPDPQQTTTIDVECGCADGVLTVTIGADWLEDPLADAIGEAVDNATRPMAHDDRDYLRDEVNTTETARDIVARLSLVVSK